VDSAVSAGGGGYIVRNCSRCSADERTVPLHEEVDDDRSYHDYFGHDDSHYQLHRQPAKVEKMNTSEHRQDLLVFVGVIETIGICQAAPTRN
jgi:hypothetical protein